MVIDLIVTKTNDGFTAEVPSLKGCESWAHDEETVINKIIELTSFYIKLPVEKIKIDRARKEKNKVIYKLIFDKQIT
jgi:predicted RNase H-like HicB family nuclease